MTSEAKKKVVFTSRVGGPTVSALDPRWTLHVW